MKLSNKELYKIVGGFSLTAAFLEGIAKLASTVFEIGEAVGSSIRRIVRKDIC